MVTRRAAISIAALVLTAGIAHAAGTAGTTRVVGRVSVTAIPDTGADPVRSALATRYAPTVGKRFADRRVISIRPRPDDATRFDATIFDYGLEQGFDLVLDAQGKELSRTPLAGQPARSADELADAMLLVEQSEEFSALFRAGAVRTYEPMPSISVDPAGRRLVNVGVMSTLIAAQQVEVNEIVSVDLPTGRVIRYPSAAPDSAHASLGICGPPISDCPATVGSCTSAYQIQWPAASPVWKLKIRHPFCTLSIQSDATGLELTDVYYQNRLILKRAEIPVLNVKYVNDNCGPFRDYLDDEDCFNAPGTDVPSTGSGIRVASSTPSTFCETGDDAGNFRGVAIYDQGDQLWLLTESKAGWYRYVMEWRLFLDGTIEPVFGFGAVSNGCTCYEHTHHVYWRFEWAIDAVSNGTTDDPATGIDTLERRHTGSTTVYDPIISEGTFVRPVSGGSLDFFRIKNPSTGNGYLVEPGSLDGTASGDTYGKLDLAGLALNANQIDDTDSADKSINLNPWLNGETLGTTKRLVTWYHAMFHHNDPNGTGETCELVGPRLVPFSPTPPPPPPPVADGMTATLASSTQIHVTWSTASCLAPNYHLIYGNLQNVSTYALSGGVCNLGTTGAYDWNGIPAASTWFLVVADGTAGTEGSWGTNHSGAPRNGSTPSGVCGFTSRNNSGTCP